MHGHGGGGVKSTGSDRVHSEFLKDNPRLRFRRIRDKRGSWLRETGPSHFNGYIQFGSVMDYSYSRRISKDRDSAKRSGIQG